MTQKVNPKQQIAITCIVQGDTQEQAAIAAGVSLATVSRWNRDADFSAELEKQQRMVIPNTTKIIAGRLPTVVRYLYSVVDDPSISHTLRIRAAGTILTHALKFAETSDILERLEALEAMRQ